MLAFTSLMVIRFGFTHSGALEA